MNEYRVQRLKEDLTFAQQRNKRQRQQLANYKKVHEKDLKEIERLNNIINELDAMIQGDIDGFSTINEFGSCDYILELLQIYKDKLKELKENK